MTDYILSKEEFIDIMENLRKADTFYAKINDVLRTYGADGYIFPPPNIDDVVFLLDKIFKQGTYESWISYFVFELEFGERYEDGCATEADGTNIDLSSAEKLYDLLVKEMEGTDGK